MYLSIEKACPYHTLWSSSFLLITEFMSPSWLGAETKTELPSHGRLGEDPTKFYPTRGQGRTAPIGLPAPQAMSVACLRFYPTLLATRRDPNY